MNKFDPCQVLVLEEHEGRRAALVEMLGEIGFRHVDQVDDGQKGLDLLLGGRKIFDLVVCSLEMSGMDGLEFIRHASELGVGGLILYSAHDDAVLSSAAWMARAYKAPLLGALQAPFDRDAIETLVSRLDGCVPIFSDVMGNLGGPEHADSDVIDEIRYAIDCRQFVPYYQPKVCLATGEIVGAEALVRWTHPELGLLAPVQFVDLMESNGLIDPLTHLVLEQAGHHAMRWARDGFEVALAVNVSPLSLERPNCAKELLATIASTGAHPSQFTFEITEKAFAKDAKAVLENVLRLRMHGCGIAVDDFGTGYSSLQQLNRTPITELKLDRSFVRRMTTDSKALSIVGSMIDLAGKLDLKTVAEGIDTEEQHDRLLELGCDIGQGYLFAKAMDGDCLRAWAYDRRLQLA